MTTNTQRAVLITELGAQRGLKQESWPGFLEAMSELSLKGQAEVSQEEVGLETGGGWNSRQGTQLRQRHGGKKSGECPGNGVAGAENWSVAGDGSGGPGGLGVTG